MKAKQNRAPDQAVAYMRYSSHNQDNSVSIEYQRETIQRYALKHHISIVKEYIDEACTGTNDRRPEFQQMLRDAKADPSWSKVIVFDTSRFARNIIDATLHERELSDCGVTVLSATQQFGDNAEGELTKNIARAIDDYQSKKIAGHVIAAQQTLAQQAQHLGGRPPLGYVVNADGHLEIDQNAAQIVREIFDLCEAGYSYSKMAEFLNAKGYRTANGNLFSKNSFNSILRQKKYTGTYIWNKSSTKKSNGKRNSHSYKPEDTWVVKENAFEPIISHEQFNRIQEKLDNRSEGKADSKARHYYMLSGMQILKCATCNSLMVGSQVTSHGRKYRVYRCPKHRQHQCETKDVPADVLEKFVTRKVSYYALDGIDMKALSKELNAAASCRELQSRLNKNESSRKNLMEVLKQHPSDTLIAELDRLEAENSTLREEIRQETTSQLNLKSEDIKEIRRKLIKYLRKTQDLESRKFLKSMIREIRVSNDEVSLGLEVS